MSQKQRQVVLTGLEKLGGDAPRVLIATGSLIGEGFDHPPLDTLVLAQPVSWTGLLEQYAGRLHRDHADKEDVRIYDYVESDHGQLNGMWVKRQRGYRKMGYKLRAEDTPEAQAPSGCPSSYSSAMDKAESVTPSLRKPRDSSPRATSMSWPTTACC